MNLSLQLTVLLMYKLLSLRDILGEGEETRTLVLRCGVLFCFVFKQITVFLWQEGEKVLKRFLMKSEI